MKEVFDFQLSLKLLGYITDLSILLQYVTVMLIQ